MSDLNKVNEFKKKIRQFLENNNLEINPDYLYNNDNNLSMLKNKFLKILSELDKIPDEIYKFIDDCDDDVFDNLFLYRFTKNLLFGVSKTLFSIDNALLTINSEINESNISMKLITPDTGRKKTSNNVVLLTDKPDREWFNYKEGMEFDIEVQDRFEDVFRSIYDNFKNCKQNDTNTLISSLFNIGDNDKSIFFKALEKVFKFKNEKLDELTLKYLLKGVNELLKRYGYREYTINKTITCINLNDNTLSKKFKIEEKITIWEKQNQKDDKELELKTEKISSEDINLINISSYDIIRIDVDIKRTTGIRELVLKSIVKADSLDLPQKAGSVYFGELGSEAGGFIEKILLNTLDGYFVSKNDIPLNKMNFLLYKNRAEVLKDSFSDFNQCQKIEDIHKNSAIKLNLNGRLMNILQIVFI